jgi:hypothetical protein
MEPFCARDRVSVEPSEQKKNQIYDSGGAPASASGAEVSRTARPHWAAAHQLLQTSGLIVDSRLPLWRHCPLTLR